MNKLFLYILTFVLSFNIYAQDQERKVLILHSYHQGLLWTDSVTSGIYSVIGDMDNIKLYIEYLDAKRNTSEEYYNKLKELINLKAQKEKFDLVLASDNVALDFMLKYGDEFFPNIPVVFCGINNFVPQMIEGRDNYFGVAEKAEHAQTINAIKKLFPERKKVFIINDNTVTGKAILREFQKILPVFKDELDIEFFSDFTLDELKEKVASLNQEYVIYLLVINRDANNKFVSYKSGINYTRQASKVPIFGSWDFYVGKGIIGGKITRGKDQGAEAARIALKILNGEAQKLNPCIIPESKYIFDYNELERFNIDPSDLPKGSIVINKSIEWEFYATVLLYFSLGLIVLILGLAVAVYIRKSQASKLELLVEEKTGELKETNEKLLALNQQKNLFLGMAAHDLRNPISTIHSMSELLIDFNSAELTKEGLSMLELIYSSSEYMLKLVNDLLDLSVIEKGDMVLNKEKIDYIDLLRKSIDFNKNFAARKNIEIIEDFRYDDEVILFLDKNKIVQVLNNLLNNAIKFSETGSSVTLQMETKGREIVTTVIDKGKGIAEDELAKLYKEFSKTSVKTEESIKGSGLGLAIAKKIVEAHGGRVSVESEYMVGSKFIFFLPIISLTEE